MAMRPICFGSGVVIACCGVAHAEFAVRMVDASSLGSQIQVQGSLFHTTAPIPGYTGPSELAIESSTANQWAEYTSYIAIDSGPSHPGTIGVKNDGFQANPGDLMSIGNPFASSSHIGAVWSMDPTGPRPFFITQANSNFGGLHAAFLGRFSFRSTSGTPTGSLSLGQNGVVVGITDGPIIETGASNAFLLTFNSFDAPVQQGLGGDFQPQQLHSSYMLTLIEWSAGPRPGGTASWIGYDMYIVQLPEPGVCGIGVLGVALASRRRRV